MSSSSFQINKEPLSNDRYDEPDDESAKEYDGFNAGTANEIKDLARSLVNERSIGDEDYGEVKSTANLELMRTLTSLSDVPGAIPMSKDVIDPRLDPNSSEFDSKFWVLNMRKLMDSDVDFYRPAKLGVAYKNLRAYGIATDSDYQSTFSNFLLKYTERGLRKLFRFSQGTYFDILKPMEGIVKPGELTVVLGRPGAGCSTFLKTIANQTYGFNVDPKSIISYDGITPKQIQKHFRGDVTYCAETENHFPQLSVGITLEFVARMKTPKNRPPGVSREMYAKHMAAVVMAAYGLSHTRNTKVGNDFIRGVSGGERKRVSIAEVALVRSALQCWDNSTRGLDSATALEFLKALKVSATVLQSTPLIAIYQCSQDSYDLFDKVIVLYDGYQIFFGNSRVAKRYFLEMGYECPQRQTTADFLTSLTNPVERIVKKGYENKVPRTPLEFYEYWNNSPERLEVAKEVDEYLLAVNGKEASSHFAQAHRAKQSNNLRRNSPMTVSYFMQVKYIIFRNFRRIKGDPSITIFNVVGNTVMGLILSSVFYNLQPNTQSFYSRSAGLFFAVLFNAFASMLEIFSLYEARPIVEKHKKYALYHPSADALASIITELPAKISVCIAFNLVLYFMINFRREPGHFFFYLLINFFATLAMSHLFRTIGASFKTLSQAMTPASILLYSLTFFTGFVIPTPKMHGWCRWINYIDPVAYAFEALISNEFHEREFECSAFVPTGGNYTNIVGDDNYICPQVGAVLGSHYVNGDAYINTAYEYYNKNKWRNFGILLAYTIFFLITYIVTCEYNKGAMQKGEILLFQKRELKKLRRQVRKQDIESNGANSGKILVEKVSPENESTPIEDSNSRSDSSSVIGLPIQSNIFHWRSLTYEVKIQKENRVILNNIDGWVKPGQVTALMGASGAGKTTLLNALSERLTSGEITSGVRMVNGHSTDSSFQRSIGYVQQQDLHLTTSTVREALTFSAYLRQPKSVSKKEKDAYVDQIIVLLEMEKYANAVVGVTGEGLNVEQRKRLTIGVELVAKPKLLVFLDEPTSGLDSQTAWSICKLIRKLADHGQSILCTIHQPSAILLQEFDRLLFLQKGGETVYFGDLGKNCQTLIDYFEKYGGHPCPPEANPAEWMLEVIGAAPGSKATQDYFEVWRNSDEYILINKELDRMEQELIEKPVDDNPENLKEFATPFWFQYLVVTKRLFEQYWRTPSYTYSKILLSAITALYNGFAFFNAEKTIQGLQNQMFSIFTFLVAFNTLVQQYLPQFVTQRDLYEVRERPSKTFSWQTFIAAQITVEIPWQIFAGTLSFFCWYYPIGLYRNGKLTHDVHERGALMWLTAVIFYVYASTMGQLCISFNELADNAANLSSLLFTMCLIFCGVLSAASPLPGFWIFMYRINPFTYCVSAMLSIGLARAEVQCDSTELSKFYPTDGQTCGEYMKNYIDFAGGYLVDSSTTGICQYCALSSTDTFLSTVHAYYDKRKRDIGIFSAFIFINIAGTIFFYWLTRVPKGSKQKMR
ncbi:pleiotropic ABC efflux transporter of multiple drugs [[Candida] railenensis]|uniref:Pleiotropic ABC efflux transporter of multiple drugs n=1 Tax=[Candida] railenensis TaxID=45579 RepID=A0A9P0QRU8_9ASCO|nr:pleiotropic ABC efflux transporter of multiple drugs [[Candida] railenensis]